MFKMCQNIHQCLILSALWSGILQSIVWLAFASFWTLCYLGGFTLIDEAPESDPTSIYVQYFLVFNKLFLTENNLSVKPIVFFILILQYIVLCVTLFVTSVYGLYGCYISYDGEVSTLRREQFLERLKCKFETMSCTFLVWSIVMILITFLDCLFCGTIAINYISVHNQQERYILVIGMVLASKGVLLWLINIIFAGLMAKYALVSIRMGRQVVDHIQRCN